MQFAYKLMEIFFNLISLIYSPIYESLLTLINIYFCNSIQYKILFTCVRYAYQIKIILKCLKYITYINTNI